MTDAREKALAKWRPDYLEPGRTAESVGFRAGWDAREAEVKARCFAAPVTSKYRKVLEGMLYCEGGLRSSERAAIRAALALIDAHRPIHALATTGSPPAAEPECHVVYRNRAKCSLPRGHEGMHSGQGYTWVNNCAPRAAPPPAPSREQEARDLLRDTLTAWVREANEGDGVMEENAPLVAKVRAFLREKP